MLYNKQEIINLFNLIPSGKKGWFAGDCPYCGREGKLGIIFGESIASYHCFRCGEKGSIWNILKFLNRLDLISGIPNIKFDKKLQNELKQEESLDFLIPKILPPFGFIRVYKDEYLEKRGITPKQFQLFTIGISTRHFQLKQNYIIILIEEDEECKGWIARSRYNKKWIEIYNKKLKEKGIEKNYLRYKNSISDFGKLILGYNEIVTGSTKTMIIVEGPFDKFNIDNLLRLYEQNEIKCGCTFGNKISIIQIEKLKKKGIEKIILMYDPDAIEFIKEYGAELTKHFQEVKVGYHLSKDPGEFNLKDINDILNNLENITNFKLNKIKSNCLSIKYKILKNNIGVLNEIS